MVYSYTQVSQYLRCPRSYRYRYLDGWREKETRAAMAFGRAFENALGAYFREEDCSAALFKEWEAYRDTPFEFKKGETWDRFVHQGHRALRDIHRQVSHPFEVSVDLECGHDQAQIRCHWLLQRQQIDGELVDFYLDLVDSRLVLEHHLGC